MKRIFLVFLGLLITVCGFSQNDLQPAATVNLLRTEAITVGQLRTRLQQAEQSAGRAATQAERLQFLDSMIGERLILQAAERDRVTVTNNELNQIIRSMFAEQIGRNLTDAEFVQAKAENDLNDGSARFEELRRSYILQRYITTTKSAVLEAVGNPTEAEILSVFNLSRASFNRVETIRASVILVPYGADTSARTRARTLADSLLRDISNDPVRFDNVAQRSSAQNSGYQSDSGYIERNQNSLVNWGQPLMDIAFNLRQGQISPVIEGPQGFIIFKVTENHAFKNLELDDVIQIGSRVTLREYLAQYIYEAKFQEALERATQELINEIRARATVQVFENNIRW